MLMLSNEEVEGLVTMQEVIAVLTEMYRDLAKERALLMPRVDHLMPGGRPEAYYGFKHMGGGWPRRSICALRINSDVITHPAVDGRTRRVKLPLAGGRWVGLVQLYSTETGALLAMFPDGVTQRLRVGATNGLGAKYLAREGSLRVGLIGSGWQAGGQVQALLAVRDVGRINVFSPNRTHRERFVAEMREKTGANLHAVDAIETCVKDVDALLSATSSLERVIEPRWIEPGMHISCIKSQEVDEAVFGRCDRVVMHTRLQAKQADNILPGTGNIPSAHLGGWWKRTDTAPDRYADLADLVSDIEPGRGSDGEITCFVNNIGLGLQFAAVGALILEKARTAGVGTELPDDWFSESVHP